MVKTNKLLSRTVSVVSVLIMLLCMLLIGANVNAAEVELAEVGWNNVYLKSTFGGSWNEAGVLIYGGKNGYAFDVSVSTSYYYRFYVSNGGDAGAAYNDQVISSAGKQTQDTTNRFMYTTDSSTKRIKVWIDQSTYNTDRYPYTWVETAIYQIRGDFDGTWKNYVLTKTNGKWESEITVTKDGAAFGVRSYFTSDGVDNQDQWLNANSATSISGSSNIQLYVENSGGKNNPTISKGTYKFSFDPTNKQLAVTPVVKFATGDVVYFDVHQNTSWESASAKMYVQFDTKQSGNTSNRAEMTKVAEGLYKYTFTEDCGTGIRFWRGSSSAMWNYSKSLGSSTEGNGVLLPNATTVSSGSGDVCTFSDFTLVQPTITVSSDNFELENSTTLTSSRAQVKYLAGTTYYTVNTLTTDAKYTYKADSTVLTNESSNTTYSWTPKSTGEYSVTVTAKSSLLGLTSSASTAKTVTVISNSPKWNITTTATTGGSVTAPEKVVQGEEATLTATANTGYHFTGWEVVSGTYNGTPDLTALTLNITPTSDISIKANFEINTYTVTFKAGDTVLKTETVNHGGSATPPADSAVPLADGEIVMGWNGTYTNVTENKTITANIIDGKIIYLVDSSDYFDGTHRSLESGGNVVYIQYYYNSKYNYKLADSKSGFVWTFKVPASSTLIEFWRCKDTTTNTSGMPSNLVTNSSSVQIKYNTGHTSTDNTGINVYTVTDAWSLNGGSWNTARAITITKDGSAYKTPYMDARGDVNSYIYTELCESAGTYTGTYNSKSASVTIDGPSRITFVYDVTANKMSAKAETAYEVIAWNGVVTNYSGGSITGKLGTTSIETADNVLSISTLSAKGCVRAIAVKGSQVTVKTTVTDTNYRVDGYVIDGESYVIAKSLGNNTYGISYTVKTDGADIVPIYVHTDAYLTANSIERVKVFAVVDPDTPIWNKYMSVYTWGVGEQFGKWEGQLMIPLDDGTTYYSYVEINGIDGITFNCYSLLDGEMKYQAFDYYDFMQLKAAGKKNYTFYLKSEGTAAEVLGTGANNVSTFTETSTLTTSNFNTYKNRFELFTNYDGVTPLDLKGNELTSTSETNAIYIIRKGNYDTRSGTNHGTWCIQCYLYYRDASGNITYKTTCESSDLKNPDYVTGTLDNLFDGVVTGKSVYVAYEYVTDDTGNEYTEYTKKRLDGQWYAVEGEVSDVGVQLKLLDADGVYVQTDDSTEEYYGKASINDDFSQTRVDMTLLAPYTLNAFAKSGHTFVGWYIGNKLITTDSELNSFNSLKDVTYTAVFQALPAGAFTVKHEIYDGVKSLSDPSNMGDFIPNPHGGAADLTVSIKYIDNGSYKTVNGTNSASALVAEGTDVTITVTTNPRHIDKFYAWYIEAVRADERLTFEEIGVTNEKRGSNDTVSFTFTYRYTGEIKEIKILSDITNLSDTVTLHYQYLDRYNNVKDYKVTYKLTDTEINDNYRPTNSIIQSKIPNVADYVKNIKWDLSKFDLSGYKLVGKSEQTEKTINIWYGGAKVTQTALYNTVFEVDAVTDLNISKTDAQSYVWFRDTNDNCSYDAGVDIIIYIGQHLGYRATQNDTIHVAVVNSSTLSYSVNVDAPVYNREVSGTLGGADYKDYIYIDYVTEFAVPFAPGSTDVNNVTINSTNTYDGEVVNDKLAPTTLETLENSGYTVEYGIITEQVGTFKTTDDGGTYANYSAAEADAKAAGYGNSSKATTTENLKKVVSGEATKGMGSAFGIASGQNGYGRYYTKYDASSIPVTNMNRVILSIRQTNNESYRGRFYNVYVYLKLTKGSNTYYYFSNMQTLNIYNKGVEKLPDGSVTNNA